MQDTKLDIDLTGPEKKYRIAISLYSKNKSTLNGICQSLINFFQQHKTELNSEDLETMKSQIKTRKSPCGQGTATWSKYKLPVHRKKFFFIGTDQFLQQCSAFLQDADIEINFNIKDLE